MRQNILGKETEFNYVIDINKEFIIDDLQQIKERIDDNKKGIQRYRNSNEEIVKNKYSSLLGYTIELIIAMYSKGQEISELKLLCEQAITYMEASWGKRNSEEFTYGDEPNPYFTYDQYWKLITVLSLGVLLDVSNNEFSKFVKIREKVQEKDYLLDTIISYRINSYEVVEHTMATNPYQEFKSIIKVSKTDKVIASEMLKTYLETKWYNDNKEMYWYGYHKDSRLYFGYWSFESGALVKILGLDDTILKDQQYYPYDMVHWK